MTVYERQGPSETKEYNEFKIENPGEIIFLQLIYFSTYQKYNAFKCVTFFQLIQLWNFWDTLYTKSFQSIWV